jgi:hypothetical protein
MIPTRAKHLAVVPRRTAALETFLAERAAGGAPRGDLLRAVEDALLTLSDEDVTALLERARRPRVECAPLAA